MGDIHKKLFRNMTLTATIHLTKAMRIRMAMAKFLIMLAARILGCMLVIDEAK